MDIGKAILTDSVSAPSVLADSDKIKDRNDAAKEKFAKDFESIFIGKIFEVMRKAAGEWGFEKDSGSEQIDGIFSMCMSKDIGSKGGMGLWKEIYQSLTDAESSKKSTGLLDETI